MTIDASKKPIVHDQVLVEAEVDESLVRFRAVVVNLMPTALWLGLLKPDPLLLRLRPNDPIQLTFRRGGLAMVAAASFRSHLGSTQARLFSIDWPEDYRLVQRRSYLRLDTECQIGYLVVSQSTIGGAGQTGAGVTRNISAGGVQFQVAAPVDETVHVGDELELRLALGQGAVLAEGVVVRVEDATGIGPDGRPLPPGKTAKEPTTLVAVSFVSISEAAQDRIVRHIFALQRIRRNGGREPVPKRRSRTRREI
jgi:hypothetical protein